MRQSCTWSGLYASRPILFNMLISSSRDCYWHCSRSLSSVYTLPSFHFDYEGVLAYTVLIVLDLIMIVLHLRLGFYFLNTCVLLFYIYRIQLKFRYYGILISLFYIYVVKNHFLLKVKFKFS